METVFIFINLKIVDFENMKMWETTGNEHDEDPSNIFLKILDMRSISTRKHEWNVGSMGPISTRKHERTFW